MTDTPTDAALEAAAALLAAHPDFRVVRRLVVHDVFAPRGDAPVGSAVIIDTETTGRSHADDRIVEVGIVRFDYETDSGRVLAITDTYAGLEDPGFPIPPASTAIHGITDAMVKDQSLDEARIAAIIEGADVVIAHNASFDRPFLESRLPLFESVAFGCSHEQVPWAEEGIRGSKLEYLGWLNGFFYEAHRSEIDCRALLEVLSRPLPVSGRIALRRLLDAVAEPALRLWARGSPIQTKDILRERGYRWDGDARCWSRVVPRAVAKEESEWLAAEVYGGRPAQIDVEVLDARVRYSHRPGPRRPRVI
jgi:DNA polymerase III subunit epsilon